MLLLLSAWVPGVGLRCGRVPARGAWRRRASGSHGSHSVRGRRATRVGSPLAARGHPGHLLLQVLQATLKLANLEKNEIRIILDH